MFINVCSSKKKLFSANNENHNIDRQTLDNHNIDRQTLDNHNKDTDTRQSQHRQTDTRQRYNLYLPQAHLITYQKGAYYSGIKILNNLSLGIKNVTGNPNKFKNLSEKFFYTLIHFIQWKRTLVNHELCAVSQDYLFFWYQFLGSIHVHYISIH